MAEAKRQTASFVILLSSLLVVGAWDTEGEQGDKAVLLAFKNKYINNYYALMSWKPDNDLCTEFLKVQCNSEGRVTHVDVSDVSSYKWNKGTLPASFTKLTYLKRLDMSHTPIGGALPIAWSQMTNLENMQLGYSSYSGPLPWQWETLTNLKTLKMNNAKINSRLPKAWSNLVSLKSLWLESSGIKGTLPKQWSALDNLEELRLSRNRLTGSVPPEWKDMKKIRDLRVSWNSAITKQGSMEMVCWFCKQPNRTMEIGSSYFDWTTCRDYLDGFVIQKGHLSTSCKDFP